MEPETTEGSIFDVYKIAKKALERLQPGEEARITVCCDPPQAMSERPQFEHGPKVDGKITVSIRYGEPPFDAENAVWEMVCDAVRRQLLCGKTTMTTQQASQPGPPRKVHYTMVLCGLVPS